MVGIVFGLGFVLSFGYWTTNFVEVQRAMASDSISAARRTPIIGAFPKMFIPFVTIIPGMIAAVLVAEIAQVKAGESVPGGSSGDGVAYNDALLYLMRDVLPNGLLGLAIAGLLAAFMAGMAANISAFNTVFSYDLWERYAVSGRDDGYYLRVGRLATVGATVVAIFTATLAANFSNIMNYLQVLFGFFNAPLFATFILGMFWKRMTPDRRLGRSGRRDARGGRRGVPERGRVRVAEPRGDRGGRPGRGVPRGRGGLRRRHPAQHRGLADDHPETGLRAAGARLLRDPARGPRRRRRGVVPLVPPDAAARRGRPGDGRRPQLRVLIHEIQETPMSPNPNSDRSAAPRRHQAGVLDIRNIIGGLLGAYGVILLATGLLADPETDKTGGVNANLWAGLVLLVVGLAFITWARLKPLLVPETPDSDA